MASMYVRFEIILYELCSYCSNNDSSSQYIFLNKQIIDMLICEICIIIILRHTLHLTNHLRLFYNLDYSTWM